MEKQSRRNLRATPALIKLTYRKCPWCGKEITGNSFDRHHWLIKRGAVPKNSFELIDVLINVVPVHHKCHMMYGQTKEFRRKCLAYVSTLFSAEDILEWYNSVSIKTNLIKKNSTGEL